MVIKVILVITRMGMHTLPHPRLRRLPIRLMQSEPIGFLALPV